MGGQQRTENEPSSSKSGDRGRGRGRDSGPGIGTLLVATACGIGFGMLTAPATGRQTRKRLRKGIETLSGEMADRWGEAHDRYDEIRDAGARTGRRMRKRARARMTEMQEGVSEGWDAARDRLAELEERLERMGQDEESGGGFLTAAVGMAVGAGVAYFLMADSAAPARSKVQRMANDARQQATDRWQQFRRGGMRARAGASDAGTTTFGGVDEG